MAQRFRRWIGWMLSVNRSAGEEESLTSRLGFARALPVEGRIRAVHPSTIQRWETGVLPVPGAVVARYEQLLKLPGGQLTAAWDLLLGADIQPRGLPRRPEDEPIAPIWSAGE